MENKQLETSGSRKPRVSKGKLKKSATTKKKRKSLCFSSSFTQKTLHNNTLLAQSLAKEKSQNQKMRVLQQELMTSRNEALMRLNETEASFDRLNTLVQKGIRQMQDVASTMGEIFAEICTSKNNPRDSASMRSSWDETVSTAYHPILKQPVGHMNGMQENVPVNDQFPQLKYCTQPLSVSAIEEELESTCSDEDTMREDSLLYRHAPPSPRQPPHMRIRKVQRGVSKLSGIDFRSPSLWAEEGCFADRTSLSVVDMDVTTGSNTPPSPPSFNTVVAAGDGGSDLSYEGVFCVDRTESPDFLGFPDSPFPPGSPGAKKAATTSTVLSAEKAAPHAKRSRPKPARRLYLDSDVPNTSRADGPSPSKSAKITKHLDPGSVIANTSKANKPSPSKSAKITKRLDPDSVIPKASKAENRSPSKSAKITKRLDPDSIIANTSKADGSSPSKSTKITKHLDPDSDVPNASKANNTSPSKSAKVTKHLDPDLVTANASRANNPSPSKSAKRTKRLDPDLVVANTSKADDPFPSKSANVTKHLDPDSVTANASRANNPSPSKSAKRTKRLDPDLAVANTSKADDPFPSKSAKTKRLDPSLVVGNASKAGGLSPSKTAKRLDPDSKGPSPSRSAEIPQAVDSRQWDASEAAPEEHPAKIDNWKTSTPHPLSARTGKSFESPARKAPAKKAPQETRSAENRPRTPAPISAGAAASRSAGASAPPRSGRRRRYKEATPEGDFTPSRGFKGPKLRVLLDRLGDSTCSRESFTRSEQDSSEKRPRRGIAQTNYKEPSLLVKIRRPVSKDQ